MAPGRAFTALLAAGPLTVLTALAAIGIAAATRPAPTGIGVTDAASVLRGKWLYARYCGGCHGRDLQGQALWRLTAVDGTRRAPALDFTGPAWSRSDQDLLTKLRFGTPPGAGQGASGRGAIMPGFARRWPDADVRAVLAFVEARWPLGVRVLHAALQPGHAGMPADADAADWRLPAWCADPHPHAAGPRAPPH